ncbi:MAG: hypothetical protein KAJ14_12530 [Candidatus Omnitrophica bacterium]|nr:hypothetical protein [Candidatus Omnitrophota bacterium]
MKSIKTCNILLNIIGVIGILSALFIWFWVFTIGLAISLYSHQLNNDASSFFIQIIGGIVGAIVIKIGIGIFRREPWARKALSVFWLFVSFCIIVTVVAGIKDAFTDTEAWLSDGFIWLCIAIGAVSHVIFLNNRMVKELFIEE